MPQLRAPALSAELVELYRAEGVDVLLETEVEELTGNGRLRTGARTTDGRMLEGYLALIGVGVVPNVELAEAAGATVDNGVVVDERFLTSLPDVYAIGDVARFPDPVSGHLRRIVHWSNANAQGAHLGRQLAGATEPYDEVAVFFTQLFDRKLQVLGEVELAAECVLRGSLAEGRLIGFHLGEDGHLVGAVVHGHAADVAAELADLLREQPVVDDPAKLTDDNLRPAEAVAA
jgi:3-phenylpropionate/trans-cinnamate dioxygenase ferredoxin reductase subunit